MSKIEKAEKTRTAQGRDWELVRQRVEACDHPLTQLKIVYANQTKGKSYSEDEDRFLLVEIAKYGLNSEERIKRDIMEFPAFRFDWFIKSVRLCFPLGPARQGGLADSPLASFAAHGRRDPPPLPDARQAHHQGGWRRGRRRRRRVGCAQEACREAQGQGRARHWLGRARQRGRVAREHAGGRFGLGDCGGGGGEEAQEVRARSAVRVLVSSRAVPEPSVVCRFSPALFSLSPPIAFTCECALLLQTWPNIVERRVTRGSALDSGRRRVPVSLNDM